MNTLGTQEELKQGIEEIIITIQGLNIGESCMYHQGYTGWLDALPLNISRDLIDLFDVIKEKGDHVLTQKKVAENQAWGVFEYICKRVK